jgi:hypothetical protein
MAAECACLASLCRRRVSCTGVELCRLWRRQEGTGRRALRCQSMGDTTSHCSLPPDETRPGPTMGRVQR